MQDLSPTTIIIVDDEEVIRFALQKKLSRLGYNVISLEKELLPVFIKEGVFGYISSGKFIDIGIPETYKIADKYLKEIC